jgi:uncharacterized membrane protein YqaE (UPF0057 family)
MWLIYKMRYLIAFICPPLAVLMCGKPGQALVNFVLSLCLYFPGLFHALLVVSSTQANKRNRQLMNTIEEQNDRLVKALAANRAAAQPPSLSSMPPPLPQT